MGDKKILFVSDRESFIIKSIMKNLEANGKACMFVPLTVDRIDAVKDDVNGVVYFYIDDMDSIDRMACTYLRDICTDKDYELYLLGNEEDVAELKKEVFKPSVAGEYYRPINANQLCTEIEKHVSTEATRLRKKHILVVDDSGTMLTTIKGWLEGKYRVTPVNSAMNAITFLAKNRPDLILLDYDMPVCSGAQFLEMVRSDTSNGDVPVIFLTGRDDAESVKSVLALKPAGYLLKSLPKETIISEVDAFFQKQKAK